MDIFPAFLLIAIGGGVVGLLVGLFSAHDLGEAIGVGAAFAIGLALLYPFWLIGQDIIRRIF